MTRQTTLRIWDLQVRLFHWLLALCFVVAFLTQEDYLPLHSLAGSMISAIVIWRMVWGLVGTKYARFDEFVRPPGVVLRYLRDILRRESTRYLGHNPAGGMMVLTLLVCLMMTSLSGFVVYAIADQAGPFAGAMSQLAGDLELQKQIESIHGFLAHLSLMLVGIHIGGVIIESAIHRENLVRAMIDGKKRSKSDNAVQESVL